MIGHRKWRDVEISAYLDGELNAQAQHALEEDLAKDPELRQRIAAMRQVVTLVRTMPLHEPRRNYLLSPQPTRRQTQPQRRGIRRAALAFRALAILMAMAFIASVGWQALPRAVSFQKGPMPAVAPLVEAPVAQFAPEEGMAETAPREMEADTTWGEVTKQIEAPAERTQEEVASATPSPTEEGANRTDAIGGGEMTAAQTPPTATPAMALEAEKAVVPTTTEEAPPIAKMREGPQESTEALPAEQVSPQPSRPAPGAVGGTESAEPEPQPELALRGGSGKPWVPIGLGIATMASALLAYWFSRRGS